MMLYGDIEVSVSINCRGARVKLKLFNEASETPKVCRIRAREIEEGHQALWCTAVGRAIEQLHK